MNKEIVAGALNGCHNREEIEKVFSNLNVTDTQEKIDALNSCMEADTYFSAGSAIKKDEEYELTVQIFLLGEWRE